VSENSVPVPRMSDDFDGAANAGGRGDDNGDDFDTDGDVDTDCRTDDDGDDTGDSADVAAVPIAPGREGLPPSYRMRHDPHYVDTLVERSAAPALVVMESGPEPAPLPAALAATAVALAEAFDAIQAALRDVPTRGRPLRDLVAIELARAEATRGRWLADAAALMQREPMPALDEVDLVKVLRRVIETLGPESRLSGGAAVAPAPDGHCHVFGDERLLTTAVGASLAGMRAVIEDRGDARKLAVAVSPRRDGAVRTLEISQ